MTNRSRPFDRIPRAGITMGLLIVSALIPTHAVAVVTIDPSTDVGPTIQRWGWDTKGGSARFNTLAKANEAYGQVPANLIRVPIEPTFHAPGGSPDLGQYASDITAIKNVLAVNPDVEVFASVKLLGANTFPAWVGAGSAAWPQQQGFIFSNQVLRPNPEHYSKVVAEYINMLHDEGIEIDYLGLSNETDGALTFDRYIGAVDLLDAELDGLQVPASARDFQLVGPDTFGLGGAESFVGNVAGAGRLDTIDIVGSHFYPQFSSGSANQWANLANDFGRPLWHTEVHMPVGSAQYAGVPDQALRDTLSVLFDSNRQGVDSFVWWGYNADPQAIGQLVKREVIDTTLGAAPIDTSPGYSAKSDPDGEPLFQAYVEGDEVALWVVNPSGAISSESVDLTTGRIATAGGQALDVTVDFWDASQTGPASSLPAIAVVDGDMRGFTLSSVPARSVGLIRFRLAPPEDFNGDGFVDEQDWPLLLANLETSLSGVDPNLWYTFGDANEDGFVDRTDFRLFKAAFIESNGAPAFAALAGSVPEPATFGLALACATAAFGRRRGG